MGFVLAIVVMIVLWRRRLFRRQHRIWNALSTFVYPYLLAVFIFGGGTIGALVASHRQTDKWISGNMALLARATLPTIKEWLSSKVDWGTAKDLSLDDAAQRVLASLCYQPESDSWFQRNKARAVNYVTLNFGKWIITAGLGAMAAYAVGRTGDSLGLDKESVRFSIDVIREMDLSRVDENLIQILERALHSKMNKLFLVFYVKAALIFGLALLLPVAECLVYFLWYERRIRARTRPTATPPP